MQLIQANVQHMSSLEIAKLTGKEHSHVLRDIRSMISELKQDDPKMDDPQEEKDSRGYTSCIYLNRELTDTLLTGYSAVARRRVIKRWQELEAQPAPSLSDPTTLRNLLLGYTEQVITLQSKVEAQRPAVEFMEQVSDTSNFVTIPEFAKTAGSGSVRMYQLLRDHGFLNEKNIPYQKHINSGWFKTIIKVRQHPKSGADIFYSLTLISGRGAFNVTRLMQRAA